MHIIYSHFAESLNRHWRHTVSIKYTYVSFDVYFELCPNHFSEHICLFWRKFRSMLSDYIGTHEKCLSQTWRSTKMSRSPVVSFCTVGLFCIVGLFCTSLFEMYTSLLTYFRQHIGSLHRHSRHFPFYIAPTKRNLLTIWTQVSFLHLFSECTCLLWRISRQM